MKKYVILSADSRYHEHNYLGSLYSRLAQVLFGSGNYLFSLPFFLQKWPTGKKYLQFPVPVH
jgi:hypothetical protein